MKTLFFGLLALCSLLLGIALLGLAGVVLSVAALAQAVTPAAPPTSVINFGALFGSVGPIIADVCVALLMALFGWVALVVKQKFGVDIEARYRDSVHSAATTGVNLALSKIPTDRLTIETKSAVVAEAVTWVLTSVPDALKHLGITTDKISALVESKINAVLTSTPVAVTSGPGQASG